MKKGAELTSCRKTATSIHFQQAVYLCKECDWHWVKVGSTLLDWLFSIGLTLEMWDGSAATKKNTKCATKCPIKLSCKCSVHYPKWRASYAKHRLISPLVTGKRKSSNLLISNCWSQITVKKHHTETWRRKLLNLVCCLHFQNTHKHANRKGNQDHGRVHQDSS